MNKKILVLLTISSFIFIGVPFAFAASSTPSATPTSAGDVEKSLQDRIKKQLQDGIDSAGQIIRQQTTISGVRAFVGTIESVSAKAITIKTVNGVKQAEVSDTTTINNDGKANAKLTDLPLGNSIIAIGRSSDNQTQNSIKIIVSAKPTLDERIIITAVVTDTDVKAKTISLSSDKFTDTAKLSTRIQLFDSKLGKMTLDDINVNDKVFTVIHQLDAGPVITRLINLSGTTPTPTPTVKKAKCGDKVCDASETPETCSADCQQ